MKASQFEEQHTLLTGFAKSVSYTPTWTIILSADRISCLTNERRNSEIISDISNFELYWKMCLL